MTLPASPSVGSIVSFKDYARQFGNNSLTIGRNSSNLDGTATDVTIDTTGQTGTLIYMDATKGWSLINDDTTQSLGQQFVTATGGTVSTSCCSTTPPDDVVLVLTDFDGLRCSSTIFTSFC